MVGRADRPVLRIVADDERAPVFTRVAPARLRRSSLSRPVEPAAAGSTSTTSSPRSTTATTSASRSSRRGRSTLRLTRRGRLVVFGVGLAAALGLGFVRRHRLAGRATSPSRPASSPSSPARPCGTSPRGVSERRRRPLDDGPPRGDQPPRLRHPPGRPAPPRPDTLRSLRRRAEHPDFRPAASTPAGAGSRGRREAARPHARCLPRFPERADRSREVAGQATAGCSRSMRRSIGPCLTRRASAVSRPEARSSRVSGRPAAARTSAPTTSRRSRRPSRPPSPARARAPRTTLSLRSVASPSRLAAACLGQATHTIPAVTVCSNSTGSRVVQRRELRCGT